MLEKRSLERFDLGLKAFVSACGDDAQSVELISRTLNVSANGVYLLLENPLPVGTTVKIEIALSLDEIKKLGGKALIRTSGAVLRSERGGMAVAFDSSSQILPFPSKKYKYTDAYSRNVDNNH